MVTNLVLSTDSLLTNLMAYTINTGCLTRYSTFHSTPFLNSSFTQYILNGRYYHGEVNQCCAIQFISEHHIQCAVMPKNFIFLGIEFLMVKCMSKTTFNDCADQ